MAAIRLRTLRRLWRHAWSRTRPVVARIVAKRGRRRNRLALQPLGHSRSVRRVLSGQSCRTHAGPVRGGLFHSNPRSPVTSGHTWPGVPYHYVRTSCGADDHRTWPARARSGLEPAGALPERLKLRENSVRHVPRSDGQFCRAAWQLSEGRNIADHNLGLWRQGMRVRQILR